MEKTMENEMETARYRVIYSKDYMGYSPKLLKGCYTGDYIGEYQRGCLGGY